MVNNGMRADYIYQRLEDFFHPSECSDIFDKIGIQFHNTNIVKKVYTCTFASDQEIQKVLDRKESNIMIFTHHPVPPKLHENLPYQRISPNMIIKMKKFNINLFSYHIALDRNNKYSPSNTLAKVLELEPYSVFYQQNGVLMGVLCNSNFKRVSEVHAKMQKIMNHKVAVYEYGESNINDGKVAIMAGCAKKSDIYEFLRNKGINVFITGVTNAEVSWVPHVHEQAKINRINILGGTHYSTEKFSLMSLVHFFEEIGLPAEFIEGSPNLMDI